MAQILYMNDYSKSDHGCLGKGCPLCTRPRTEAEVVSLLAARQKSEPRAERPCDSEPQGAA